MKGATNNMKSNIGEIIDEILPYTNRIEMSMVDDLPFIKAYLSGRHNTTKAIMYIIQVSSKMYSVCDDYDYPIGERIFPSGNPDNPFITEKEIILAWVNNQEGIKHIINLKSNIDHSSLMEYVYNRLWHYDAIRFNPDSRNLKFAELGFTSSRIRSTIDKSFSYTAYKSNTIGDLISLINDGKSFPLYGLKDKEINCVFSKLKNIGIIATIDNNNSITRIKFDRKK